MVVVAIGVGAIAIRLNLYVYLADIAAMEVVVDACCEKRRLRRLGFKNRNLG